MDAGSQLLKLEAKRTFALYKDRGQAYGDLDSRERLDKGKLREDA
jgi:hypothetical protein